MTLLTLPAAVGSGWSEEPGPVGGPLLVVLSGLAPHGQEPAFEGRGLCRRLGVSGVLLRDAAQSWYLRGVEGVADDLEGLAQALRGRIAELAPSRLVLMGNSAGGYAAVALASLLDADEVVAVVPRSGLSHAVNDALGDDRFADLRASVLAGLPDDAARFLDLRPLLLDAFAARCTDGRPSYRTRVRVLHASDNALDAAHAARLSGLPETVVATYPRGDHQLAAVLRGAGELDALVDAALAGPRLPAGLSRSA
ncbi:MAG: sulfotransferase [Frankiales bacterium]|nr:sulfotransferase [Frankiales bacterium]